MGNKLPKELSMPQITCSVCLEAFPTENTLAMHDLTHNKFTPDTVLKNQPDPNVEIYWLYSNVAVTCYYFMNKETCELLEQAFQNGTETITISQGSKGQHAIKVDFVQGKQLGKVNVRVLQRISRTDLISMHNHFNHLSS